LTRGRVRAHGSADVSGDAVTTGQGGRLVNLAVTKRVTFDKYTVQSVPDKKSHPIQPPKWDPVEGIAVRTTIC
jgi:hypothetical protein